MTKHHDILDEQTLQSLGAAPVADEIDSQRMQTMRQRVMQRIDDHAADAVRQLMTVRRQEGEWIEIFPNVSKKVLFSDPVSGAESYLLKAGPGAIGPAHRHELDEHCIVLEGDVQFGDIKLTTGDYHFAPAGSEHGSFSTRTGLLIYIQTGVEKMQMRY